MDLKLDRMDHIGTLTAKRVRAAYKAAGITIETLSDSSGIAFTTLKRRLAGHGSFRLSELVQIADVLGIPYWQLLPTNSEVHPARGAA